MNKFILLFGVVLLGTALKAQQPTVVNWQFQAVKVADKTYEIHLTPTVQAPWHIYSQTSPEEGAVPTSFQFGKNPLVTLEGKVQENGKLVSKYEEVFGVTVKYFEGKVDFVQRVKLKASAKTNITGSVEFMVCNDEQCLPPQTMSFSVPLN
mgnify:CR=1 FL=1